MSLIELLGLGGIGLLVGLASSLFGLGGGVVITPLLPLILPLAQKDVVATSLSTIFVVTSLNVFSFARQRLVSWRLGIVYGFAAAAGSSMSAYTAGFLSDSVLRLATFFVLIFFVALLLRSPEKSEPIQNPLAYWPFGVGAGALSGLTGVGTGAILSPFFLAKKVTAANKVTPTSNLILVFASVAGMLTYLWGAIREGRNPVEAVNPMVVIAICLPAMITAYFGRRIQNRMPERGRRVSMAAVVCVLAFVALWPLIKN